MEHTYQLLTHIGIVDLGVDNKSMDKMISFAH